MGYTPNEQKTAIVLPMYKTGNETNYVWGC